ncbi:hypothetical protein HD806DRAFT_43233 [Xylariaceae sp. AK1471]|nr:hypothetical protein HD806DRAFT_43233 [Xylariaceae sp. AK1471]
MTPLRCIYCPRRKERARQGRLIKTRSPNSHGHNLLDEHIGACCGGYAYIVSPSLAHPIIFSGLCLFSLAAIPGVRQYNVITTSKVRHPRRIHDPIKVSNARINYRDNALFSIVCLYTSVMLFSLVALLIRIHQDRQMAILSKDQPSRLNLRHCHHFWPAMVRSEG